MFKKILLTAVFLTAAPIAAVAATISGQIDIVGSVNLPNSTFDATGNADLSSTGGVVIATGDFAAHATPFTSTVTLNDIDFTSPGAIWSVGGFTFTASSFADFQDVSTKAFSATGIVSGNGFDDTSGFLTFTAQANGSAVDVSFSSTTTTVVPVPAAGLLLLTALGGVAATRRRRKAA